MSQKHRYWRRFLLRCYDMDSVASHYDRLCHEYNVMLSDQGLIERTYPEATHAPACIFVLVSGCMRTKIFRVSY